MKGSNTHILRSPEFVHQPFLVAPCVVRSSQLCNNICVPAQWRCRTRPVNWYNTSPPYTQAILHSSPTNPSIPRPPMIPPIPPRKIRLHPRILHRHAPPHPPLQHTTPIQPAHIPAPHAQTTRIGPLPTRLVLAHTVPVAVEQPQVLACRAHRHVLALEFALLSPAALA